MLHAADAEFSVGCVDTMLTSQVTSHMEGSDKRKSKTDTVAVQNFGVRSLYYGRHRKPHAEELGAEFQPDLDKFLAECDVITINCPLTDKTR